jgi:hypothetical protein
MAIELATFQSNSRIDENRNPQGGLQGPEYNYVSRLLSINGWHPQE